METTEITKCFVETTEVIRKNMEKFNTKKEMLAYLTAVEDYIKSSKNIVKSFLAELE